VEDLTDRPLVERAVRLRARRAHGRALARVQNAEVNARAVDRARHRAAERIDLFREMPLADAADRRVAAHLAERLDVLRRQQRAYTHARGGKRGLGSGMTAADHDATVANGITHGISAFFGILAVCRTWGPRRGDAPRRPTSLAA